MERQSDELCLVRLLLRRLLIEHGGSPCQPSSPLETGETKRFTNRCEAVICAISRVNTGRTATVQRGRSRVARNEPVSVR